MTREEAKSCIQTIELLRRLAFNVHGVMDVIDAGNCDKIIALLSQEPCDDCISRVDAMRAITDKWVHSYGKKTTLEGFTAVLYNLPPVIPEQPVMTGEFITGSFTGEEPTGEWITSTAQVESEDGKT